MEKNHRKLRSRFGLAATGLLATVAFAQTEPSTAGKAGQRDRQRSFAIVEASSMRMSQGSWGGSAPMYRYVKEHPGRYVIFTQDGALYRLDDPERITEVRKLYQPMQALAAKQEALAHAQQAMAGEQQRLAHSQQSLARQQQSLSVQQVSASTSEDQTRLGEGQNTLGQTQGDLGSAQGDLGRQQTDLGSMQGVLGREQTEVARSANKRMQTFFDGCLADGSCRRVTS